MSWGTGQGPVCKVNNKQLRYFEGDSENYHYPWRDNFREMRDWLFGQCPGGHGHRGQDSQFAATPLRSHIEGAAEELVAYLVHRQVSA
jgi:hypothetical protein